MKSAKIKNFPVLKILLGNIAGMIVLLIFTNFVIVYSEGGFELPFYDRNKNIHAAIPQETNQSSVTEAAAEEPSQDTTNIRGVVKPEDLTESEIQEPSGAGDAPAGGETIQEADAAPAFELYSDEMKNAGFTVSDGVYDPEGANAYKFVKIEPEYKIPQSRSTVINDISRPSVEAIMDYILIRSDGYEILCAADGRMLSRDFAMMNFEITHMRDAQNRTVFKSKTDELYYVHVPEPEGRGSFIGIKFDPVFANRGVPFMYPSYYGANGANNLEPTRSERNGKWGYMTSDTKKQVVSHIYGKTFNFNENIGVAYQDSSGRGNKLFFLNENGQNLLSGDYYGPNSDAVTAGHLGFFYFDHGMTRAYVRSFDRRDGLEVVSRETILKYGADAEGYAQFTEFYIPEDYTVKAYSNGMILLEKDGFYGFMNYLGEWVYQPIFKYAQPFYEGVAVIGLETGKRALIDTNGNRLTRFRYDMISNCTGGIVVLFEKNEGWTILNKIRKQT